MVTIRLARREDYDELAQMRHALWPDGSVEEHRGELENPNPGLLPEINLVAEDNGELIGFAEVALRSRAEGCESSPVGYLEGWYVKETHRRRGIGAELLRAAEEWAADQGCTEFASDTWLDNELSQRVHRSLGFEETDRIVTYRKSITPRDSRATAPATAAPKTGSPA